MTDLAAKLADDCTRYACTRLAECLAQIERCVGMLSTEQIWHRPNEVSNAVGNLLLHLAGNVRQWVLGGLRAEAVARDRPAEFAERGPLPSEAIIGDLRRTVERARNTIANLTADDLARKRTIQNYEVTGLAAVFHVVEHFSLHTGQIVYAAKLLTGRDLSLYDPQGRRLDGRASGTP